MSAEAFSRKTAMGAIGSAPEKVRKAAIEAHQTGDKGKLIELARRGGKASARKRRQRTEAANREDDLNEDIKAHKLEEELAFNRKQAGEDIIQPNHID